MKATTRLLVVFLALAGTATGAWADRGHFGHHGGGHLNFGITVGPYWGGWWSPWYFPPPSYYYPPVVVERETQPPVIIQQPSANTPAPVSYWYFCRPANAYYPYVRECPVAWEKVAPEPAGQQ